MVNENNLDTVALELTRIFAEVAVSQKTGTAAIESLRKITSPAGLAEIYLEFRRAVDLELKDQDKNQRSH